MTKPRNCRLLFLDFDGTLFQPDKFIAQEDIKLLHQLEGQVWRVIATGRSLFSLLKVINNDFPIDFLIFSTGVGVMDWKQKNILRSSQLSGGLVDAIVHILQQQEHSFFVHFPLPLNHHFYFHVGNHLPHDFERRFNLYRDFSKRLKERPKGEPASQILVISHQLEKIKNELNDFRNQINIVRATSPLDGETLWVEIFEKGTSKAMAAHWLAQFLNIKPQSALAVGNDYNDADLLQWAGKRFVVPWAPDVLKQKFPTLDLVNQSLLKPILEEL